MREIKLVDIKSQYLEIKEDLFKEWEKIFDSMNLMLGPNVKAFEKEFANYSGKKFGVGVDSGTMAVFFALKSIGIGEGDSVFVPSFTFFATVEAVIYCGAKPIFVDIEEDTYTISFDYIENYIKKNSTLKNGKLFDKKTQTYIKAIVPVHLFGLPADMNRAKEISEKYSIHIVEDSAQAHGAEFNGKKAGSFGITSAFSFYFSKNLSALGEAGIVLTDDEEIYEKLKRLRIHGQSGRYEHIEIGYNSRLDEVQAVVLRLKLKKLDEWNEKREKIAKKYIEELREFPLKFQSQKEPRKSVWHLFTIRTEKRDELAEFLKENGIQIGIHYPIPVHKQKAIKSLGYQNVKLPVTEKISNEILSLPMHPHLNEDDILYIKEVIKKFFKSNN